MKALVPSFLLALLTLRLQAQNVDLLSYDTGSPTYQTIWVDPQKGNDAANGDSRETALATLTAAWRAIPASTALPNAFRIAITQGTLEENQIPHYQESRWGSASHPLLIESVDGVGKAIINGPLNIFDCQYFYLVGLVIGDPVVGADPLHFEACDHVLLRHCEVRGSRQLSHETLKINQSTHVYLENCFIHGAEENALDFVAVQYGHIRNCILSEAGDWAAYLKGGSAYFVLEGNVFSHAGTGGFTAGQGTGLEFMNSPWLHYEASDLKVINNVVHDVEGAAFGVNGGLRILIAHNTAYKIGTRSHLLEVVRGDRSCDGNQAACQAFLNAGAWGTTRLDAAAAIPSRDVFLLNNLLYNPSGTMSQWQQLTIGGPQVNGAEFYPAGTVTCDTNLVFKGNLVWNGPADHPLGIGDDACTSANPTCNEAQLLAQNWFNVAEPQLSDANNGDFRPLFGGNMGSFAPAALANFTATGQPGPPDAPLGSLANAVSRDFTGQPRSGRNAVGAWGLSSETGTSYPYALYLPHWTFLNQAWTTLLTLANAGDLAADLRLTLKGSDGSTLGQQSFSLAAGSGWHAQLASAFPVAAGKAGWCLIESSQPGLSGLMTFTFTSSQGSSSLPLIGTLSDRLVLTGLTQDSPWTSGLALVNPGNAEQEVELRLQPIGEGSPQSIRRTLAAGSKWVTMLSDLFGSLPKRSFLIVQGSAPLTGFALSFTSGNQQIVAVPAQ